MSGGQSLAAAGAHVHVTKGGGPVLLAIGVILFIVGVVVILAAASFQKRMGLSPGQTAPPGPIQVNINRFIGAGACLFGVAIFVLGVVALR
jgi:hypothetical protein